MHGKCTVNARFLFPMLIVRLTDRSIGRLNQIARLINRRFKHLSTIKSFEDLPVWQDARKFTNRIYNITNEFPKEKLYGLTSQIRRAAVSIMSNIAKERGIN